jgi:ABC-type transporter Mla subunit MlaD
MVELRERLNIVRADLASLLVSVQNLHEKAEEMDKTLTDAENLVDNPDEGL